MRILQHNCNVESEADVEGLPRPWNLFDELRAADRGAGSSSEEDDPREGNGAVVLNTDNTIGMASASGHEQESFHPDQTPGAPSIGT